MTPKSDLDRAIEVVERRRRAWIKSPRSGAFDVVDELDHLTRLLRALKEEGKG